MFQDPMGPSELQCPSGLQRLAGPWLWVEEATSTNDLMREQASRRAPEGAVLAANAQTRGKGRLGRTWESPAGLGLYCSVLLRPPVSDTPLAPLTLLAGVAAANALVTLGIGSPSLKWPNDLLLAEKKTGGILCEFCPELSSPAVIVGIGINVHHETTHFPPALQETATSLFLATGQRFRRADLLRALVMELDREYIGLLASGPAALIARWSDRTTMFGRRVTVTRGPNQVAGMARRLDAQGRLVLETGSGELAFDAGEVTLDPQESGENV